jgi:hypothetical protein
MKLVTTYGNFSILFLIFCLIVVIPFFPAEMHRTLYNAAFTALFFITIFALNKYQKRFFSFAVVVILTEWASFLLEIELLIYTSIILNIIFFVVVVVLLIAQLINAKEVSSVVILEAVNGYLLLGIAYSLIIAFISHFDPDAFGFTGHLFEGAAYQYDYFYYGFITYSTLGYGDISPLQPYSKGISILITVSGQLYLAVIIATLIGKHLGQPNKDSESDS